MTLTEIDIYPVKSMRGLSLADCAVAPMGLAGDRRWMVIDAADRFVTGRLLGALTQCRPTLSDDGVRLTFGADEIDVPWPSAGAERDVVVWKDTVTVRDAGDAAAAWLTERMGRPLRLVYQHDTRSRPISGSHRLSDTDTVSLADGYPLLATTTASLAELNGRLGAAPVTMRHFRPNLVIDTDEPFVEDTWNTVQVGDARFAAVSACARCIFTTVDPQTGLRRDDGEPMQTLRGYRQDADTKKIFFGVNLIPLTVGTLCVGDAVSVS